MKPGRPPALTFGHPSFKLTKLGHRGWTRSISHHLETIVAAIVGWYSRWGIRNQGFLGAANWIWVSALLRPINEIAEPVHQASGSDWCQTTKRSVRQVDLARNTTETNLCFHRKMGQVAYGAKVGLTNPQRSKARKLRKAPWQPLLRPHFLPEASIRHGSPGSLQHASHRANRQSLPSRVY